ncbi:MAG: hypothetical protein PVJ67_06465 [Candidatus Pacearchaeota archaeon]|jgi:hypothetical protein
MGARMMRKKLFILLGILFLLNVSLVSSHFVCGVVENSDDNFSASWFNVNVFYSDDELDFTTCEVSPQENKYCCDVEDVDENWDVGDVVLAKVSDYAFGYVAGPVSVVLSNEGYDVASTMKLEKVISVYSPKGKVILSNETSFFLNASFLSPYNFIEAKINNLEKEVLCEDCESYEGNFSGEFGMNDLRIFASSGEETFSENVSFAMLSGFDFNREAECKGCRNNYVRSSRLVNMKLGLNLSNEVSGFLLKEYVPSSWEVLDSGSGELKSFNENYNLIVWNVSGEDIFVNYSVESPKIGFRPQEFLFKSELENLVLNEEEILVKRFFSFFSKKNSFSFYKMISENAVRVDEGHPLVFDSDDKLIHGGVFVNKKINNAKFKIYESGFLSPYRNLEIVKGYSVLTNLGWSDVEKVSFELKVKKKDDLEKDKLEFFVKNFKWDEIEPVSVKEDEEFFYFSFETKLFSKFFIGKEKESFFRSWFRR